MRLTELIKLIGDENIKIQSIDTSLIESKDKKKTKDTEITFATNQVNTNQVISQSGKVGLVIWINRSDFTKATNS